VLIDVGLCVGAKVGGGVELGCEVGFGVVSKVGEGKGEEKFVGDGEPSGLEWEKPPCVNVYTPTAKKTVAIISKMAT
jgi:hypothetical protein